MAKIKSRNDLKSNTKTAMIELLNARLAEGIDLALVTKQAHWNLKGTNFIGLHEMLEKFYNALNEQSDMLAERMVLLGGVQTLAGPLLGAGALTWLHDTVARNTDYWRALLGATMLLLVLAFPQGLAGFAQAWWARRRGAA